MAGGGGTPKIRISISDFRKVVKFQKFSEKLRKLDMKYFYKILREDLTWKFDSEI